MKILLLILISLLAGCDSTDTPTPAHCRDVGVNVADSDTITGIIAQENTGTQRQVQAMCQSPFEERHGCSLAVAPGEYVLWYMDDPGVRDHERCHALYEEWRHEHQD